MPWGDYLIIFVICAGTIVLFRTLPMMLLTHRELPQSAQKALSYIPVAAFTALVVNDLYSPGAFSTGVWPALLPYVASVPVIATAVGTRSLALCIVVGCVVYTLLLLV